MSKTTQQQVLDAVGEKWIVTYTQNGEEAMGLCNHHRALPALVSDIRAMGGKNIRIEDKTIFLVSDSNE